MFTSPDTASQLAREHRRQMLTDASRRQLGHPRRQPAAAGACLDAWRGRDELPACTAQDRTRVALYGAAARGYGDGCGAVCACYRGG
jgi:hypothetical protein